jgi:hypothetical protein
MLMSKLFKKEIAVQANDAAEQGLASSRKYYHTWLTCKGKGKAIPLQAWTGPEGSRFQDNRHMKVVRLSALRTGHLYPQEISLVLISVRG